MAFHGWLWIVLLVTLSLVAYATRRLIRSLRTLRALALVPVMSRRLSRWVKARDYSEDELLQADGAGQPWIERRRQGLNRLAWRLQGQHARSIAWGNAVRESFSDLRFTDASRVP